MYGHDTNTIRSRYDYYYSVSSPSLSQAASYFDNQASLFGEPVAPLLPPPIQKNHSPSRLQTPLTPFNTFNASTPSSASANYVGGVAVGVHPPMIENFDNHLYESIRRDILDRQNNNSNVTATNNALTKHQLWTQNSTSSSNSPRDESNEGAEFESKRKRASTAFGHYKSDDDVSQNKYRTLSARGGVTRCFNQLSNETTTDTDNNNRRPPSRTFYANNRPNKVIPLECTSNSSSSKSKFSTSKLSASKSRLNHSISHSKLPLKKKPIQPNKVPYTMVKSKSDLNTLKTYPDSFTIITSPKRSPSAGYNQNKRLKGTEEDDDSMMDYYEWVKPPTEKLYEAASTGDQKTFDPSFDESLYISDHFGQRISVPSSPIITDKIMIGSSHRVPPGSFNSHKKIAFAIINDYKNRKTRLLQHRHSEDNMSLSGRFSPYSRYVMQRELSAPNLNRIESFESDDGEFYYVVDDEGAEEGRQTSIGFVHNKKSISMGNLSKPRPQSEMRQKDPRYMSTPNFIKINKRAVIQSIPMERINPRLVLHRSLKGVLKVYNNANIKTKPFRQFSVDNMEIFLPNGKIDPALLAPMPINKEDKRSERLKKYQAKAEKRRKLALKERKKKMLSPIAGTPNRDNKEKPKTPKKKPNTPATRLEERLKKDQFGRLVTAKKEPLPNFRESKRLKAAAKKKLEEKEAEEAEEARVDNASKAVNFLQQIQARSVLGKSIKARIAARQGPPPLTRQPSKQSMQSVESLFQDNKPLNKKKSGSFSSLKSLSTSIKTIASFTGRSNKSEVVSIADEEAEVADELGKLHNVKEAKKDTKGKLKAKSKAMGLSARLASASSTRSQKEVTVPPPSRSGSKTSIFSRGSNKETTEAEIAVQPKDPSKETPSRKSEVLRAPSASSIMSMTSAAITSNPLVTTLAITNTLATQGSDIIEKKRLQAEKDGTAMPVEEVKPVEVAPAPVAASQPDADRQSIASQNTISSQKASTSKPGSRKTSAAKSGKNSASSTKTRSRAGSILAGVIGANSAIRYLRRKKSQDSIHSEKSDATHLTTGPGTGADNESISAPTADPDANNNAAGEDKTSAQVLSRHSTKLSLNAGMSKLSASSKLRQSQMSVNAISVAPDAQAQPEPQSDGLQRQASDESNQMNSSTSSSMNEMSRKRKICCGLSSCCGKTRSESAQMIAGKSSTQPLTRGQKCANCCCLPFRKVGNLFKRRKVDSTDAMSKDMPSFWERMCCCSSCCRRCKKGESMENMEKKKASQQTASPHDKKPSCWSRINCFKCCNPCCSRLREACCCSACCRKKGSSTDSLQSGGKVKDNETPGTCTRIFCFCCLCCRKKPPAVDPDDCHKYPIEPKKGNCCSRMCNALLCCRKKKKEASRRTSMLSKKQSLAPTIPPPEIEKPKIDMVLVEHASLMKGAIPVMPICLAWFCFILNILLPGTGTIISGFFCLCIGIPRFSQHDGARGRIGSFIINWIVGVAQAFTIIFCLVGWGWSVWWGTIMLTCARRYRRIKKAEAQSSIDEQTSRKNSLPGLTRGKSRDAERGIN